MDFAALNKKTKRKVLGLKIVSVFFVSLLFLVNISLAADAPVISSVSPDNGSVAGGTSVTIAGTNFGSGLDSYVKLLLHADGSDATFVDSALGKAVSAAGNATQSTTKSKFGGKSLALDGTGDYLSVPASADWGFGTGDFTVEAWINTAQGGSNQVIVGQFTGSASGSWGLKMGIDGNQAGFTYGNGSYVNIGTGVAINDSNWHHVAAVRNGTSLRIYIDGVSRASATISAAQSIGFSGNPLMVGYNQNDNQYVNGYIDEVRVSKGIARWTSNFSVPIISYMSPATVAVGGSQATNVQIINEASITATTPAHSAGLTDVVVTNSDGQFATLTNGYLYNPAPTLSAGAVLPSSAKKTGGDTITITGTDFYGTPTVTLGGTAATSVTVVNPTTIIATTPAHAVGDVDVVVTNPDSQSATLTNGFTYTEIPPTISQISPNAGSISGGTNVTITGTNFLAGAITATGGTITTSGAYTIHTFTSSGTFTTDSAGPVEVLVVAGGGGGGGSYAGGGGGGGGLIYNSSLAISAGSTSVNVGSGGAGGTNGLSGTNGNNSNFGTIIATGGGAGATNACGAAGNGKNGGSGGGAGAGCAGQTYGTGIVGQGNNGGSSYSAGGINASGGGGGAGSVGVSGISGNGGNGGNGIAYSISGSSIYYSGGGGGSTYSPNPLSSTPGTGGLGGGGNGARGGDSASAPVDATSGTANTGGGGGGSERNGTKTGGAGGSGVVIVRYLTNGKLPTVTVGGNTATNVAVVNSTTITATIPAHAIGATDVVVTNYDGQSTTLTDSYTFNPAPTITAGAISPSSAKKTGGDTITITGTDFYGTPTVTLGGTAATSVTVVNPTTITATTPAHAVGDVDVVVTNPDSQSATLTNGFTYTEIPPTISQISPNAGSISGGTNVTITGTNFLAGNFGSGSDGSVTISANKNINVDAIAAGRTCADGINYSVTGLTANTATLSATPAEGCLSGGDEILLVNLQGISTNFPNAGKYETLKIQSISSNVITFSTNKTKKYGNNANDDSNIGTASTNQRVMLQRVPNYYNVTVNSGYSLTASPWDGTKGGILFFRANGTVTNTGSINANGLGYRGGTGGAGCTYPFPTNAGDHGESYNGQNAIPVCSRDANVVGDKVAVPPNAGGGGGGAGSTSLRGGGGGGGGSFRVNGANGVTNASSGEAGGSYGSTYGGANANLLFFGSGGGGGGEGGNATGGTGGKGGGIVGIAAKTIVNSGTVSANGLVGANGSASDDGGGGGGGGAGGSVFMEAITLPAGTITVNAGAGGTGSSGVYGTGGNGGNGGTGLLLNQNPSPTSIGGLTFDGVPASNISIVSPTTITATTPVHAAGSTDVVITNYDGQSANLTNGYTFNPAPTLSAGAVSPSSAKNTGGDIITITGTGFYGTPTVTLGGTAATSVIVVNSTTITATTPAHASGAVNVVVTNSDSQSATLTNGFTFTDPPPTVSQISPTNGSLAGGTSVTINGTGFLNPVAATGGTVTTSGAYTIHTFTAGGTFVANRNLNVEYLVIGGGGGGANARTGGGGGAGGYRSSVSGESSGGGASAESPLNLTAGTYPVTVGAGGASNADAVGSNGGNSTFSSVTAIGGGGGGIDGDCNGRSGGSGGGARSNCSSSGGAGTAGQGYRGGNNGSSTLQGAGGGGAGAVGGDGSSGAGGTGVLSSINGTPTYRAGGGGGGSSVANNPAGGNGGGGTGANSSDTGGTAGVANTGGGGGGGGGTYGGKAGGSGVVIVRYLTIKPTVSFGGTLASNVSFINSTTLTATTPAHIAGLVDVIVTNYDGQSTTLTNGYTFNAPPTLSAGAVSPSSAKKTGGDTITITGTGFYGTPTVTLGGTAATNVTVINSTTITATTPAHAMGQVNVVVTNPDSQSVTLTNGFTYTEIPPAISQISPNAGFASGGTNVTITGTDFSSGVDTSTKLLIRGDGIGSTFVDSSTFKKTVTPIGGATQSTAQSKFGGSSNYFSGDNSYLSVPNSTDFNFGSGDFTIDFWMYPTSVTGSRILYYQNVSGSYTPVNITQGGTALYLYMSSNGTSWDVANGVSFGTIAANNWYHFALVRSGNTFKSYINGVSQNTITSSASLYSSPANLYIGGIPSSSAWFAGYFDEFRISKGAARWTSNFTPPTSSYLQQSNVTIGGTAAKNIIFSSPTSITATTLAHAAGATDVVVTNYDGQFATLTNGYTFNAPPTLSAGAVSPSSALKTGGDTITITGTGFYGTPTVTLGGTAATNVTVVNSTTITATTPAHAAGAVSVVVTNPDSQSATLTNGFIFTELPPTLSGISPNNGPVAGGTNVTITGTNFIPPNMGGDTWSNVAGKTMPASLFLANSAVIGDHIYLFGGTTNGSTPVNTIYSAQVSDPTTWTNTGKTLPISLAYSNLAVVGSYVYLFGGHNGTASITSIYRASVADPTTWSLVSGKVLPGALRASNTAVIGDKVYLFGGLLGSSTYTNVIYSAPVSDPTTWIDTGKTLPGNSTYGNLVVAGNTIYLFGGYNGSIYTNTIYSAPVSDPTTWINTGKVMPDNYEARNVFVIGEYIYFAGGFNGTATNTIYSAPVSDPTTWTNIGKILPGNLSFSQTAVIDGYAYMFGGYVTAATTNVIYRAPIQQFRPFNNLYNKIWETNWPNNVLDSSGVTIGGNSVTNINVVSPTSITVTTPAHAAGATDVVVTNYDGQSATLTNGYTFNEPPTLSTGAVSPSGAKLTGGDTITITGTGFYGTPAVTLGGTAATNVTVVNPTTITATTPAHAVGAVDVVITNPDTQSATLANGFTFTELPPTVSLISPTDGPATGGTNVTITGTNFIPKNSGGDASWATVAGKTLPGNLQYSNLATVDNKVYLFGGFNGTSATNVIYTATVADPTTWTVVPGKTLPSNLHLSNFAAVGNNLYLFGGNNGTSATNVIYTATVADPTTWTVVSGKTLPGNLTLSQPAIIGNNLYLFGGSNGSSATNVIYTASVTDPTTWTVVSGKTLPGNLFGSQLAIIGSNMYLFGGYNTAATNVIYTASVADPTTWTVVSGKTIPVSVYYSQIITVGDYIYLLGGSTGSGSSSSIFRASVADPTTWTTVAGVLPVGITASNSAIINSNVYLFGGNVSNVIYRAPLSHNRPNVYNKSWLTNWNTIASDQSNMTIGGVSATNINFVNATTVTATTAANVPSDADVVVTNYDGQSATLPGAFEYHNWITRGTYTSSVKNLNNTALGMINWVASTPTGTAIAMKVKSCTTADCSDKPSWTGCELLPADNNTDISGKGCAVDGEQFVQYQAYLTTDLPSVNPYLDSVTISDQPQYPTTPKMLLSSPYNSENYLNAVSKITWNATNDTTAGTVQMQIRTAPDNGSGVPDWTNSVWCGPTDCSAVPNSTSDFATSYYTDKAGNIPINSINKDSLNDQWVEYATFLNSTDGAVTPTLSDVSLSYVVNAPPELQNVAAIQESDGTITVAYDVRDPDTDTGATRNKMNMSLEYCSANCGNVGGETWTNAPTLSGDYGADVAVEQSTWSSGYQMNWDVKTDYQNQFNATNFKVRVKANDGEGANNVKYFVASVPVLDTKNPALGAVPLIVDASVTPASATLSATDDSDLEMKVSTSPTLSGADWEEYSATKTITLGSSPSTIYAQFKDAYGNLSSIQSATTPEVPSAMMIQDTSNANIDPLESRLFVAWKVTASPAPGFGAYKIYRSEDQVAWSLVGTINNRLINYYGDNAVSANVEYFYKVVSVDLNNNVSAYSAIINGNANGIQDAGEGGNTHEPPVISNVTVDQITSVSARVNWTTDTLSNSTVGYSTTSGNFNQETGVGSMVTNHSVTVGNLSPNTKIYFQVKSTDSLDVLSADDNGGSGYDFTTATGDSTAPVISAINVSAVSASSATITWDTDENANSFIEYSKTDNFTAGSFFGDYNLTTNHLVTVPSLEANATYYFKVHSRDVSNNNQVSSQQSFTTTPSGDVTSPVISEVAATPSFDTATITWNTDEDATSYVEYGTTASYGRIFGDGSFVSAHSVPLPRDLLQETTYHFRVHSTDGSENESISVDNTFTTTTNPADFSAPILSNISIGTPTTTSVNITWDTNENATSFVGYSLDGGNTFVQQGTNMLETTHSVTLVGLNPNKMYLLKIISADSLNNIAIGDNGGAYYAVATPLGPQPPTLSGVTVQGVTFNQATITWNSSSSATSFVEYGLDTNYGKASGKYDSVTNHSVSLDNLQANQTYHFRVRSTGEAEAVSGDYTFSTQAAPDATPPSISNISASADINTALISWTTNEVATSYVEYGTDTNYGNIFGNNNLTMTHSVQLPADLASDTVYHYRVRTSDALGNSALSTDNTIQTTVDPLDETAPNISNVSIVSNSPTTITVTWNTDENSSSYVAYSTDGINFIEQGTANMVQNHSVTLIGLNTEVAYKLKLKSADAFGNVAVDDNGGNDYTQITQSLPNAPIISNVASVVSAQSTTITWTTDIDSDSEVEYGNDTNYGTSKGAQVLTKNHSVTLSGLTSGAVYHFRVHSKAATERVSGDNIFTTQNAPDSTAPVVSNIVATPAIKSVLITWTTNEPATSYVEYGTTASYGSIFGSNVLTTSHSISLPSDLSQNTTYHYRIRTSDALANQFVSSDNTVKTLVNPVDEIAPVISGINIASSSPTEITVTWTTDEESTSYVAYSIDGTTFKEQGSAMQTQNHSVTLVGLAPSVSYQLQIKSADSFGNVAADDNDGNNHIQITQSLPNAPAISNINVNLNIDGQAVTITWITDINSDSEIEYGIDANYGTSITNKADATSHSVTIKNLTPLTTYHFRAHSTGSAEGVSGDQVFTTLPPLDSAAPIISGIVSSSVTSTQATVTWNTNKNTNSILHYGINTNYTQIAGDKDESLNTHFVQLSSLEPSTTYHYQIEARDDYGNVTQSADQTFTTLADTTTLDISNVTMLAATQTSAVISWDTNKDASTKIIYGKNHDLDLSSETALFGKTHYITISELEKGTNYFYKVISVDALGNTAESSEQSFDSAVDSSLDHDPLKEITFDDKNPSMLTDTAAVLSFTTDQVANCYVEFGTNTEEYTYTPVKEKTDTFNKTHAIALTGLLFNTKHYYKVTCQDNLVDSAVVASNEKDFTTLDKMYSSSDVVGLDSLPPTISNVRVSNIVGESATITWDTDEKGNSLVGFGISSVDENNAGEGIVNKSAENYAKVHSVTINGLIPATKYTYFVSSADAAGNISKSSENSFETASPSSLSSIKVESNNLGEATVTWKTSQESTSTVEYGLSTSYGEKKENSNSTTDHVVDLSNLTQGATYHYRVSGKDKDGRVFASSDNTFEPKSPAKITNITINNVTEHGATVTFKTDVPTDSEVNYTDIRDNQKTGSQGSRELTRDHKIELTNLDQGTTFAVTISVRDEQGTESSEKAPDLTTGQDITPPKIENVKTDSALAQSDKVQTIISWKTDEQATTSLVYKEGSGGEERELKISDNLTNSHVAVITVFKPGVVYNFKVKSVDSSGNEEVSSDFALLTPKRRQNIIEIIIGNFTEIFGWAKF